MSKIQQIRAHRYFAKLPAGLAILAVAVVGTAFTFNSRAATPFASLEPEQGTTTAGVTIGTDSTASGGQFVQFGSGQYSSFRGPNGKHWPANTPAYTTPATKFISSLAELNSTLATAQSGEVIEVAPHTYSSNVTLTNGNPGWAQNVLVRPPLGQRQSVIYSSGTFVIDAPHVTIAGFQINSTFRIFDKGDRSAWARIVMGQNAFFGARNNTTGGVLEDAGIYEIVATTPKLGADRLNVSAISGGRVERFTVSGVWLKGAYRAVGSADHSDTLQTFGITGGVIGSLTFVDAVLFPASSSSLQLAELEGVTTIRNSWIAECRAAADDIPQGYECGGFHAITGGNGTLHIYDSDIVGSFNLAGSSIRAMYNSRTQGLNGSIQEGDGNIIDPSFYQSPPALMNLNDIWE